MSNESAEQASQTPSQAGEDFEALRRESRILVITGLSGAGRETASNALEDLGWYVVGNLPVELIVHLSDHLVRHYGAPARIAIAIDTLSGALEQKLRAVMTTLDEAGVRNELMFLTADDASLVRRFDSVRRPHPMQESGGILEGIHVERVALEPLRRQASLTLDTSGLNVHEFTKKIREVFGETEERRLQLTVMSFGFKYGVPMDADHMADVRFIANPYWVESLRELRGTDEKVRDFVFAQPGVETFTTRYLSTLEPVLAGYSRENKNFATIAIGCTGGKHRSVAIAERLGRDLREAGNSVRVAHRDLGRE